MSSVPPVAGAAPATPAAAAEPDSDATPAAPPPPPPRRGIVGWNPRRTLLAGPGLGHLTIGNGPSPRGGVQLNPSQNANPTRGHVTSATSGSGPGTASQARTSHGRNEFTAAELAKLDGYFDGQHYVSRADLDEVAKILNTPAKASAFVNVYFQWVDTHENGETYAPLEQLRDRLGVCRDQHSFVTWVLRQNGYDAYTVAYSAPDGILHAVPVYQRPDGTWAVIDYGTTHESSATSTNGARIQGFDSLEAAIHSVEPGAFRFRIYEVSDDPTVRPVDPVKVYETHVSLESRRLFNGNPDYGYGPVSGVHAPGDPNFGWGANVRADLGSAAAQIDYGALSLEARKWYDADPMLDGATGARLDVRIMEGLTLSGGVLDMPGAFSHGAGWRTRTAAPFTAYYVGAEASFRALDLSAGPVYLRDDVRLDANLAIAVQGKDGKVDKGATDGLSYFDAMNRLETGVRFNDRLSLYAGANSFNPLADVGNFISGGGRDIRQAPLTLTSDVGLRYQDWRHQLDLKYYQPIQVRTNLYGDRPKFLLSGSTQLTPHIRIAASVESGISGADAFSGADAGVRLGPLGVSAGVSRMGETFTPRAAASVDVIEAGSMLGLY